MQREIESRPRYRWAVWCGGLLFTILLWASAHAAAFTIERVSIATGGLHGTGPSDTTPSITPDGRYVAFRSSAANLVASDTNSQVDIFVRDRQGGTTTRESIANDGSQANGASPFPPAMSADGRYVAFASDATNLVAGDTNGRRDVFVRDRQANTTTRVSVAADGTQGDNDSIYPTLSPDGRFVAFTSLASNLLGAGMDTNGFYDIFVRDRQANTIERVSVSSAGAQGNSNSDDTPALSPDGRYVAFRSQANTLLGAGNDTNGAWDIFLRDRQLNTTERVSIASNGTAGNLHSDFAPAISADGQYVVFASNSNNLVVGDTNNHYDIFVRNRQLNTTTRVNLGLGGTQANGETDWPPAVSADGRFIAYTSGASNLVANDTNSRYDTFVLDRTTSTTVRVNVSAGGAEANGDTWFAPTLTPDGRYAGFGSAASNLLGPSGDTNGTWDIFMITNPLYVEDTTAPACAVQAVVTESPSRVYVPILVTDAGSGVAQVKLTSNSTNCRLEWTGPGGVVTAPIGTPLPISPASASTTVRVVKINTSQRARVELQVWDGAGNTAVCDPVIANLELKQGRQLTRVFNGIPQAERYITLQNGTPGLQHATLSVNGRLVSQGGLTDGQVVSLDVDRWLRPGKNTVRIAARGPQDATAVLTIGDVAPSAGASLPTASMAVNPEFAP